MCAYAVASRLRSLYTGARHTKKESETLVRIELPKDVKYIIGVLMENGYEAYAVGGCVRDSILKRVPGDWDITTSALPMQVKALFRRTIDTGIQHGTVTVMLGKNGYEVTTYRIDGKYEDSRHPESVEFTPDLHEDLKRRDFTINAMAYNDEHGIVDIFDGVGDLDRKLIRCVGNAHDRFNEDALRILRAVRFSAQLGFDIDEDTAEAARELAPALVKISRERIHTELNKLLLSGNPDYFSLVYSLGIMKIIIPELKDVDEDSIERIGQFIKRTEPCLPERYAAFLSCVDADMAGKILKGLKLDNATITMAAKLVKYYKMQPVFEEAAVRYYINEVGEKDALRIIDFNISVCASELNNGYTNMRKTCVMVMDRGDCTGLSSLRISGKDLKDAGFQSGKQLGVTLQELLREVLDNPQLNERDYLLKRAVELKEQ